MSELNTGVTVMGEKTQLDETSILAQMSNVENFHDIALGFEAALLNLKGGMATDEFRDQLAERVGKYLTALSLQRELQPTVDIKKNDDNGFVVDITLPIDMIPQEYLIKQHNYYLIRPRKGKLHRAIKLMPEHATNVRQLANKVLRGWYVHSHKGKSRRKHRLMQSIWMIDTGPTYTLRPPFN